MWRKRLWRCDEPLCSRRTWSETTPAIGRRAASTERARRWACQRVGRDGQTVQAVRVELGVGWNTVMRAVRVYGTPLIDDTDRLAGISGLGVDEHVWQHPGPKRRTGYATGVVDLTPGRPPRVLEVVKDRTGQVYADWIATPPHCTASCRTRPGCWTRSMWSSSATQSWRRFAAGSSSKPWVIVASPATRFSPSGG